MRRRHFLTALAAQFLAFACGRIGRAWENNPNSAVRFVQLDNPVPADISSQQVRIIPRGIQIPFSVPHSFVVLEAGAGSNRIFVDALFSVFGGADHTAMSFSSRSPGSSFEDIFWPDRRALNEIGLSSSEVHTLLDHFDFNRSRAYASGFELFGSAGPWLIARHPTNRRAVLLDFSGYQADSIQDALINWKTNVLDNQVFWKERSKDWAFVNILAHLNREWNSGLLQLLYEGQLTRKLPS